MSNDRTIKTPLSLFALVESPKPLRLEGHYDETTQTWSNRDYESAGRKKHNESM